MIAHTTSFGFLVMLPVKKQLFLQAGIVDYGHEEDYPLSLPISMNEYLTVDCE